MAIRYILTNTLYHILYSVLLRTFPFPVSTVPIFVWVFAMIYCAFTYSILSQSVVTIVNAILTTDKFLHNTIFIIEPLECIRFKFISKSNNEFTYHSHFTDLP